MTIYEAVSLVLQAFTVGEHGDILVLDMGKPIRIADLARTLVKLSGMAEEEVGIVYTGLRPGEKLHEALFYATEEQLPTPVKKVRKTRAQPWNMSQLMHNLHELRIVMATGNENAIRAAVQQLIPEYSWNGSPQAPSRIVPSGVQAEIPSCAFPTCRLVAAAGAHH